MEEDETERELIPIETYTDVWRGKKNLYTIWDYQLPWPIPVLSIGVFLAAAIPWMSLLYILNVPITSAFGFVLYLAVPVGLVLMTDRELFEKKSLMAFLQSQVSFWAQSKTYDDGRSVENDPHKLAVVEPEVWVSMEDTYPATRKRPRKSRKKSRKEQEPAEA